MTVAQNIADHSSFSRVNLGPSIAASDSREKAAMHSFSDSLLRALWREHPHILRHQAKCGRLVVKP